MYCLMSKHSLDHYVLFVSITSDVSSCMKLMHSRTGVSKTQTTDLEKKKKRRTKGLEFITLASKGCFCVRDEVCVFEVCGLRFRGLRFRDTHSRTDTQLRFCCFFFLQTI